MGNSSRRRRSCSLGTHFLKIPSRFVLKIHHSRSQITAQPRPSYLHSLIFPQSSPPMSESLQRILSPPPAFITGLCTLLPPAGVRINTASILSRYKEAIASLSQRLGTDKWFLGSRYVNDGQRLDVRNDPAFSQPTPLDAVAFAYLHCMLHMSDVIRLEVTRRVNLVAWEWRVRCIIREGFTQ